MPDQPPSDRFKVEMPQVRGVASHDSRSTATSVSVVKLVLGVLAVILVVFMGARWALRSGRAVPKSADQQPQIDLPTPAPDPNTLAPHATDAAPGIADT